MASSKQYCHFTLVLVTALLTILLVVGKCSGVKKTEEKCKEESKSISNDKDKYIQWFTDCIADYYGFEPDSDKTQWNKVPTLENVLEQTHFKTAALVAEEFFWNGGTKRKWDEVLGLWKKDEACAKMLYVTAARYIYYTYLLVTKSAELGKSFGMCKTEDAAEPGEKKRYILPEFSCYPENAGSKTCTSDADVGLVGPNSGKLVGVYNEFFREKFGMTSEELFDNNVYAYSIEMAMPEVFIAAPGKEEEYEKVKKALDKMDNDVHYQMQDLAFAYFKVYMYKFLESDEFFLSSFTKVELTDKYKEQFNFWYDKVVNNLKNIKDNKPTAEDATKDFSSNMYSWLVEWMSENKNLLDSKMSFLLISHVFASEAYLSRGALRVVVGAQQMGRVSVKKRLTPLDHWCSMTENYGDVMKEYNRNCEKATATAGSCLIKLSKYLWRAFVSAEQLYKALENNKIEDIKDATYKDKHEKLKAIMKSFEEGIQMRATDILKHWIDDLKKKGIKDIEEEYTSTNAKLAEAGKKNFKAEFFKLIGCDYKRDGKFPKDCMQQISYIIRAFNERMVYFTNKGKVAKQNCIEKAC